MSTPFQPGGVSQMMYVRYNHVQESQTSIARESTSRGFSHASLTEIGERGHVDEAILANSNGSGR